MPKSGRTDTVIVVDRLIEWDKDPLAPVTVIAYVPEGKVLAVETVRVEAPAPLAERVTSTGLKATVSPDTGAVAVRVTTPVKEPRLVSVVSDVAEAPCIIVRTEGLVVIPKSG